MKSIKKIIIAGVGLGADSITLEACEAIKQAEVIFGAPRLTEPYKDFPVRVYPVYLPDDVAARIEAEDAENFVVLISGDVGFYSAATGLCNALSEYSVRLIPGISTVNAFFARLKMPWQDSAFVSVHGRDTDIIYAVRRNRLTFCLTGNNAAELGCSLFNAGFSDINIYVGENLGLPQERVYETTVQELQDMNLPSLTVLLFVNENFDDRILSGLPDGLFTRTDKIPMTKSEVRAVVLSKLCLRPDSICYDIGAGTGSVSVEMALSAYRGRVYAIERREDAISLIQQNSRAFHLGNVIAVHGEAPDILSDLPVPDAVFIGGSGGELCQIIDAVLSKNPEICIVITAVTIETVSAALAAFNSAGIEPEIVQISTTRIKKVGGYHMMDAQNPVTIFSAGGKKL